MIVLIQRKDNLMIEFITVSTLERSIKSIYIIVIILLIRRKLNINSTNKANKILWSILFIYLIFPYSILIEIENQSEYIVLQIISEFILVIQEYIRLFTKQFGQVLSAVNRLIVSILFLTYIITQIIIRNKAMKTSILIENNERINKCVSLFRFKRKIKILVNDKIKVPVTYGVIRPKIILQSHILYDDELLKHVLIHELVHIQKFDIIFSHIKNLITCAYWYNLFIILASKYIEDDIEILCDKLVVQQIGDSVITRKNYCLSMLNFMNRKEKINGVILKLHPAKERIIIIKKRKKTFFGICVFVLAVLVSLTSFVDVKSIVKEKIVSSEPSSVVEIIDDNRVKEITDFEYNECKKMKLGNINFNELKSDNIDNRITLKGLRHKSYKFNMSSCTEANHDGFIVKMSNMYSKSGLNYAIIIKENGNTIYNASFAKATILTVKAHHNSRYEVIISNQSTNSLTYRIKINSYIR